MGLFLKKLKSLGVTLRSLSLSNNGLNDSCIDGLVQFINHSKRLRVLELDQNNITDEGFKKLGKALLSAEKLQILNISSNENITEKSLSMINDLLVHESLESFIFTDLPIPGIQILTRKLLMSIKSGKCSAISLTNS